MGVGRRLIQRRHKLRDDVRKNVPGFDKVEKMDSTLNEQPGSYSLVRKSLRRQNRNFGKDSLDRKLALAWEADVSIARHDFGGSDFGLKVTLLSGTADDINRGFKAGDKLTIKERFIAAKAAIGSIAILSTLTGADLTDGDTITLDDGSNSATVFEFDSNSSVTLGHVAITFTNGDSSTVIATSIKNAINGVGAGLGITASLTSDDAGDKVVALVNDSKGSIGNEPIASSLSTSPGQIVIYGMVEGSDARGSVLDGQEFVAVAETNSGDVAAGQVRIVSETVWRLPDNSGFVSESSDHIRVELGAGARLENV